MRATDAGLDEPINVTDEIASSERDPDLKTAQEHCKTQPR